MKNLTDDELLDFLMTSDFDENLSPEELKHLLVKFRYFFRIATSKQNTIEIERKRFVFEIENIKSESKKIQSDLSDYNQKLLGIIDSIITRKLSFKERFFGKVKPKSNEVL